MKEKLIDKQDWCCYDRLAAAIVEQAIKDWRLLIECGVKAETRYNELRKFFKSPHCELLLTGMTLLKPAAILRQLEKEREEAGL